MVYNTNRNYTTREHTKSSMIDQKERCSINLIVKDDLIIGNLRKH